MTLADVVKQIAEKEHMGKNPKNERIEFLGIRTMRIYWEAEFEGREVTQFAEFQFNAIRLEDF